VGTRALIAGIALILAGLPGALLPVVWPWIVALWRR